MHPHLSNLHFACKLKVSREILKLTLSHPGSKQPGLDGLRCSGHQSQENDSRLQDFGQEQYVRPGIISLHLPLVRSCHHLQPRQCKLQLWNRDP